MSLKYSNRTYFLATLLILAIFALTLFLMSQIPICKCGYVKFWHGIVHSSENSQHLTDWYSFSHIIHGFIFYWILKKLLPKFPIGARLVIAVIIEAAWEIFENTDYTINRYREVTISLDYYGDSIINSVFDVLYMILGFALSMRLPVWLIVALAIGMEIFAGYMIRDNLFLNIVMLLYPFDFILNWQSQSLSP